MKVEPYLFLNGRCDEAIKFYQANLGAQVLGLMRFKDNPAAMSPESCGGVMPAPDSVMHSCLRIGETNVMMSDGMPGKQPEFKGFSLSVNYTNVEDGKKTFDTLAEGGRIEMPWAKTFYSPGFGMVADRFGVPWMVIVDDGSKPA